MNPVASARVRRRASEMDATAEELAAAAKAPGMEDIVEGDREGDIVIPKIQLSKQWREALNTLSDQLEENKLRSDHMRQKFPDLYNDDNESENSDEEFHIVDKATMSGRACGIFGPTNLVRRIAYAIMYNKPVYIFVLLLIVLNSITLALNGADQDADTKEILDLIDLVLLCCFTIEAILRVIALGLFWGSESYLGFFVGLEENPLRAPMLDEDDEEAEMYALDYDTTKLTFWETVRSYVRNPSLILEFLMSIRIGVNWPNLLDFVVVVAGWIELASNSDDLRAFRALRALRPLRVLKFFSGIQAILNSLIQALPLMANVLCLVTFFFVIYGILGVQSFSGALRGRCQDSSGNDIVPETFCSKLSSSCPSGFTCNTDVGNPNEGFTHFDNILWAFITIFQCVTLEAWTDNMYWAQDGAGDWSWLYFVTLIMLCSFLVLNLFVAVICASFARVREEQKSAFRAPIKKKTTEEEEVTLEEVLAAQEAAEMLKEKEQREAEEKEKNEREQKSKENEFMRVYYELHDVSKKVVDNDVFNTFILLCIVLNTIFMAMEHDGMSQTFTDMLNWAEFSFSIIFLIECVVKILGLSPRVYFMHAENVFDFIIVFTTIPLILSTFGVSTVETGGLSLLRVFRLLRVMRLFRRVESLRELMKTVFLSFKSIGNLMGFIILFLCIFAFVGMQFFGGEFNFSEGFPRENFDNFGSAMLTLFIMMGGENWNAVMYNTMRVNEAIGVIYSVSFYILANFIMLNLFVAVISENFELDEEEKVKKQIEEYEKWLLQRTKAEEGDVTEEVNLYDRSIKGALLIKSQTQLRSRQVYGLSRDKSKLVWGKVYGWIKGPQKEKSVKTANAAGTEEIEMNEAGQAIGPRVIEMEGSAGASELGESGFVVHEDSDQHLEVNGSSSAADTEQAVKDATLLAGRQLVGQDSGMRLAGLADEKGTTHVTTANEFGESVRKLKRRESLMSWYNIHGAHHRSNKKEFVFDKALLCLSPSNRFRIKMNKLVDSKWFEIFILVCIVASSILLALDSPAEDNANLDAVVEVADWIFLVIFLVEFLLKITAKGIILPPGSYFSNSWNQLDFFVLVVTILAQVNLAGDNGKVLRILRTLRPLRMINKSPGMQIIIKALLQGLPSILNVVALMVFFFLVYGILGVQQFAGLYRACNDGGDTISTKTDCAGNFENDESVLVPRVWGNPSYASLAFDDIFGAFRTLFEVSSLEGWLDVMYSAQDITGSDKQPSRNSRWWNAIFFVTFIFLGSFFMLQLFVGVLIYSFDKVGGSALLTDTQKQWLDMKRLMDHSKPAKESFRPKNRCQGCLFNVVMNPRFDRFIMTCIIINTVFMASEFYGMPGWWSLTLDIVNYIFLAIFTVEAILKLLALDYRYFKSGWNVFDFVVVLGSYIGLILGSSGGQVARIFRLGRIIRLIQRAKGLRMLFNTLVISLPSIINISSLLFLLFFIYAVIGTQLFSLVKYSGSGGIADRANFRNFPNSMLLLFRMATGENWQLIMAACLIDKDECTQLGSKDDCPAEQWMTYPYFFSFYMIGAYVFVNLFIATILSNFDNCYNREESDITAEDIRIFKIAWRKIHTMYSLPEKDHLPLWKLQEFVDLVGPPLGFKTDENRWRFRLIYEELRSGVRAGRENLPPAHPRRGPKYRDVLHTLAMHRMSLSSLKYIDRTIREEALLDLQRKDAQRKIGASVRGYLERKLLLAEVSQLLSGPNGGASRPGSRNGGTPQASERSRQAAEELSLLVNSENSLKGTFNGTGTSPEADNVIEVQYNPNPGDIRAPPPTSTSTGLLSAFRGRKK